MTHVRWYAPTAARLSIAYFAAAQFARRIIHMDSHGAGILSFVRALEGCPPLENAHLHDAHVCSLCMRIGCLPAAHHQSYSRNARRLPGRTTPPRGQCAAATRSAISRWRRARHRRQRRPQLSRGAGGTHSDYCAWQATACTMCAVGHIGYIACQHRLLLMSLRFFWGRSRSGMWHICAAEPQPGSCV